MKKENEVRLRKLYPNHGAKEIAHILGIHASTVSRCANRLNLIHSSEYIEREKARKRMTFARNTGMDNIRKRVKSWKLRRRMDEIRFMSGMQQKTKFRMKVYPQKLYSAMYYLHRKYGYEFSETDYFLLVRPESYDKDKLTKVEEYYMSKYKIKFT